MGYHRLYADQPRLPKPRLVLGVWLKVRRGVEPVVTPSLRTPSLLQFCGVLDQRKNFSHYGKSQKKRGSQTGARTTIRIAATIRHPLETPALSRTDRISSFGTHCEAMTLSGLSRFPPEPHQENVIPFTARSARIASPFFTSRCSALSIIGAAATLLWATVTCGWAATDESPRGGAGEGSACSLTTFPH